MVHLDLIPTLGMVVCSHLQQALQILGGPPHPSLLRSGSSSTSSLRLDSSLSLISSSMLISLLSLLTAMNMK